MNSPNQCTFSLSSGVLFKEVAAISKVVNHHPMMPILQNILLRVGEQRLTLMASDLTTTARTTLPISGSASGEMAIPTTLFLETLRHLPDQMIEISIDMARYTVEIKPKKGLYRIACENPDDFPLMPQVDGEPIFDISSTLLKKAIKQSLFAAGKDEMRPALAGVNLSFSEKEARFVAIDGHRLVRYTTRQVRAKGRGQITLGRRSIALMTQFFGEEGQQEVAMTLSGRHAFFSMGDRAMTIALIEEPYPDYENIIPRENPHRMVIDRKKLMAAVKIVGYYANKTTAQILFNLSQNQIELCAEDLHFSNRAQNDVACRYDGPDLTIGLNATFLMEMLNHMPSEEVVIHLDTPKKAVILEPDQAQKGSDDALLMLIMPSQVKE